MGSSVSGKKAIAKKAVRPAKKIGAVDAFMVSYPDLASRLNFQNLLNYFLECINQITSGQARVLYRERLVNCVKILESEFSRKPTHFTEQISADLEELLSEAKQFLNILEAFTDPGNTHPVDILLSAKACTLQWLAVCLLEDFKITLATT